MKATTGKLYLIPTTLGETAPLEVLPISVKKVVSELDTFIVENEKSARRFIKSIGSPVPQDQLNLHVLNKYTPQEDLPKFLTMAQNGGNVGLMSEAGMPAIADPGSNIIEIAHRRGIRVVPLVGPSSIIMALISSGFNGQNFAFNGYLPIEKKERKQSIKRLEKQSLQNNQTQIFIETPYRNMALLHDLVNYTFPETRICLATDISLPSEEIITKTSEEWSRDFPDIHKKPTVFLIQA